MLYYMRSGEIHIGTSGWSYGNWPEFFYPAGTKPASWLTHYATIFNTTEVNSSFYRLPMAKTVANWIANVPGDFKFCVKMSKYLTHIKRLKEPEEPLQRFFNVFGPVKDMLGPILIQLPASLQYDAAVAAHFFKLLSSIYREYDFVLEVRHSTWMLQDVIDLMSNHNIGFVISQSGVGFPYAEHVTSQNIYVRFHGPGKLYASSYSNDMLRDYADKFKTWSKKGHTVWAYFNNTMYEHGVNNAITLKDMVISKKQ